jgi:hypothetical protein
MSDPERIERLETRVDRIEDHHGEAMEKLSQKIDALGTVINNHLIAAAKAHCPSPGACLLLASDMKKVIIDHDKTLHKVLALEDRILTIEKWQGRVIGGIAVLMVALHLFGEQIRQLLRLG